MRGGNTQPGDEQAIECAGDRAACQRERNRDRRVHVTHPDQIVDDDAGDQHPGADREIDPPPMRTKVWPIARIPRIETSRSKSSRLSRVAKP